MGMGLELPTVSQGAIVKKGEHCYGWPRGSYCPNAAKELKFWCEDCDRKRIVHIDKQFQKLLGSNTEPIAEKQAEGDSQE